MMKASLKERARRICGGALLSFLVTGAHGEGEPWSATVAPFKRPPTVDGTLAQGEWDGALRIPAVMNYRTELIVPYHVEVFFGFDAARLFFAIVSELPPDGKLLASQTRRDSTRMIEDDGIEIFIDPNRLNRAAGAGDRRYYHYHGNSLGAFLDMAFDAEGAPDMGWQGNWQEANGLRAAEGVWIKELSIPWTELGVAPGEVIGRDLGILVARNIKRGVGWQQCTWFPHHEAFSSVAQYPLIRLTANAPTVSLDSFGGLALHKGPLRLEARIFNRGPARRVRVELHLSSSTMPELAEERFLELAADGFAEYQYHVPENRLHEDAVNRLVLSVTSPDSGERHLRYATGWTQAPAQRWPGVALGPQPDKAMALEFYPSLGLVRLRVEPRLLELEDVGSASYRLETSRGVTVRSGDMRWTGDVGETTLSLPGLLDDVYTVTINLPGWDDPLVRTFERKHYPWENTRLGITDQVLPPFEPIRLEGDRVDVVLRSHALDGLGFWRSVKASGNVSARGARELLARPMVLVADGKEPLQGTGAFSRRAEHEVVYEGRAEHDAVVVQTRMTTEVDGCMKVELTLRPPVSKGAPRALTSLHLDIPLVDALMPLYHVVTTSLRSNPAGNIPAGEGHFWDTRHFPDGSWYGNFKPYIWLGAEERGLAWFADNDAGWVLDVNPLDPAASAPCLELIRQAGVLTLRINLVQKPIVLEAPRVIVFGLMASPAKPMPAGWRTLETAWMGSQYWGSDENFAARYPRNADLSPLDMMMALRLGREFDFDAFLAGWRERNFAPGSQPHRKTQKDMEKLLAVSRRIAETSQGKPFTVYWEEFHSTSYAHPERRVFEQEWGGKSTRAITASYRDFAVWWGAEFVRRGMGLYFDNSFPMQAFDPLTTSAYRLPSGAIQPSAGIWARREYLKRIWVVHQLWGDPRMPPLMMIHMTNTHMLPYMVWNQSNLDLEWFYGDTPVQQRYARDLLRVESIGRQTGNIPFVLANGSTPRSTSEVPNREEMGAIFEVKFPNAPRMPAYLLDFGYGQADCDVFNYWDERYPVRISDPQVASILLCRAGKARLLLLTWNGARETITVSAVEDELGFAIAGAVDVRSGTPLPVEQGIVTIDLEGYGARLIDLRGAE